MLKLIVRFISFIKPFKIFLYVFVVFPSEAHMNRFGLKVLRGSWPLPDLTHGQSFCMFLGTAVV
jgi:hypothetical protein